MRSYPRCLSVTPLVGMCIDNAESRYNSPPSHHDATAVGVRVDVYVSQLLPAAVNLVRVLFLLGLLGEPPLEMLNELLINVTCADNVHVS